MKKTYDRGSEWRKWDLHLHTPKSICQMYGKDDDKTWEKYIQDLESLPDEFSVLGINDYLFLDGYERLLKEQNENNRLQKRLLLPVVEFRIEKFAGMEFGKLKRINLHVIFSNEVSLETIKSQFLNTLEQHYYLQNNGERWSRAITRQSIEELGKKIKSSVPAEELSKYGSDLVEGFNNLNVREDEIFNSLKGKDCFNGKYLIAIGKTEWGELKWLDSSIATKKSIINQAHIVFTAAESVATYKNAKSKLQKEEVNDLLLDCSDAHYFSSHTDKDRIGNCFTWIKADTTFDGLKQILNEHDRVFVGDIPPIKTKVQDNRTKYISKLSIKPIDGYDGKYGKWFDNVEIPINHELVAIIGNKGSGKSALADIIALCGFYKKQEDFSFLNSKKFRKGKHANNFEATLTWESENSNTKKLSDDNTSGEVELVKYIPQGYFERLTNEISTAEEFQKEIENVVFAHLKSDDKVGYNSFDDLIKAKEAQIKNDIDLFGSNIKELNSRIVELENKLHPDYKKEINRKVQLKEDELLALTEPVAVKNPNEDSEFSEQNKIALEKIETLKTKLSNVEGQITTYDKQKQTLIIEIRELQRIKQEIEYKIKDIELFKEQNKTVLEQYGLSIDEIITISFNLHDINKLITEQESKLKDIKIELGEIDLSDHNFKSLNIDLIELQQQIQIEQEALDIPHKAYQNYLTEKNILEKKKNRIIGNETTIDTLAYYKRELKYLDESLADEIQALRLERMDITKNIFDKKQEVIALYKFAKQKLDEIIQYKAELLKDYKININAALCLSNSFQETFFKNVNRKVSGTFYSIDGGDIELNKIIQDVDFDNKNDVALFLDNLNNAIHEDQRDIYKKEKRFLVSQIKNPIELYNYLFELKFLDNNYQLMQGEKNLQQLSPGERGALLLVFYLLLDKSDIPLIIDQPEDNLDNNSVANILVPFIREAKSKRQIIMVTHNPNLAVVSDAEQVIYVHIDKNNDNLFTFKSGSIENREINDCIVKVLEGAMPAFNKRKQKYYE
jgi:ABC-type lipoprotein export system ATPase subunit